MKTPHLWLAALFVLGCTQEEPLPGCPATHAIDAFGACRLRCGADTECLGSEECLDQLCVPREDQGPKVTVFRADRAEVPRGESIRVDYVALFADRVTITPDAGSSLDQISTTELIGSVTFGPIDADVGLTIVASRGGQTDTAFLQVTLAGEGPVTITAFTAQPTRIVAGQSATLDWNIVRGDGTFQLREGQVILTEDPAARPFAVQPTVDTVYTLIANGNQGPATAEVTVYVDDQPEPLEILSFEAVRSIAGRPGDNAVLHWVTSGAERLQVFELGSPQGDRLLYETRDPLRAGDGRWVVVPLPGRSYRLTIEAGSSAQNQVLSVAFPVPPPAPAIQTFTVTPRSSPPSSAGGVTLDWSVTPFDAQVTLSADGAPVQQSQGSGSFQLLFPERTTVFDLEVVASTGVARAREVYFVELREQEESNDDSTQAQRVEPAAIRGAFRPMAGQLDDDDWYAVSISDGHAFAAAIDCGAGPPNARTTLELFDSTGALLAGATEFCPVVTATNLTNDDYYLRASSAGGTFEYGLFVAVLPPRCGNGVPELGEACDDGNGQPFDPCTPWCALDPEFNLGVRSLGQEPLDFGGTPGPLELLGRPGIVDLRDRGTAVVELPFEFPFFGQRHRGVFVNVDGFLSFHDGASPQPLGQALPDAVIAPFAADLVVPVVGGLSVGEGLFQGTRVVVIDVGRLNVAGAPNSDLSARVGLLEDGRILVRYRGLNAPGTQVQAGLEDGAAKVLVPMLGCDATNASCAVPQLPGNQLIEFGPLTQIGGN